MLSQIFIRHIIFKNYWPWKRTVNVTIKNVSFFKVIYVTIYARLFLLKNHLFFMPRNTNFSNVWTLTYCVLFLQLTLPCQGLYQTMYYNMNLLLSEAEHFKCDIIRVLHTTFSMLELPNLDQKSKYQCLPNMDVMVGKLI